MATEPQKKSVFISYSRSDYKQGQSNTIIPNNIVSTIKAILDEHQISYWIDEEGISATTPDYMERISKAINQASVLLFIATENSCHSRFCKMEVAYAVEQEKPMIIVKNVERYSEGLGMWLAGREFIDHLHKPEQTAQRIVEAVKQVIVDSNSVKETLTSLEAMQMQINSQLTILAEYREVLERQIDEQSAELALKEEEVVALTASLKKHKDSQSAVMREIDRLTIELDKISASLAECKGGGINVDVTPTFDDPALPEDTGEEIKQSEKEEEKPEPAPIPEPTPEPETPIIPSLTRPQSPTPTPMVEEAEPTPAPIEKSATEPPKVSKTAAMSSLAGFFKSKEESPTGN